MRKLLILLFFIPFSSDGAIDPIYAEAMERGYDVMGDSVLFPDGSRCSLRDFNDKVCGQKWYNVDYCVEEGEYVWNMDKCCEGLEPFLPKDVAGQYTCQKKLIKEKNEDDEGAWYENILDNSMLWIGVLIPFIFLIVVSISIKRRMNNEKDAKNDK